MRTNRHRNILLGLCLACVTITCGACAAAPALMLTTAAVSTVAVLAEGERLIGNVNEPNSVMVKNDADVFTGPGEGYSRKGTLREGDRVQVLGRRDGWVECLSDPFDRGWIQTSDVSDI